jgi:hypothetical protein
MTFHKHPNPSDDEVKEYLLGSKSEESYHIQSMMVRMDWMIMPFLMMWWIITVMKMMILFKTCMGGHEQLQGTKGKFHR